MVLDISAKRVRDVPPMARTDSDYAIPRDAQRVKADDNNSKGTISKRWTPEQDEALRQAVAELGHRNWMAVAERVPGRDNAQCLQRWNKVLKPGLVKGPWSVEEDAILIDMMQKGYDSWRQVSAHIPGRTAKQCRERWRNRLDPNINRSPFSSEEDDIIQQAYEKLGNRWTQIAELLPGRTEDAVKLRWKTLNPNQRTYTKLGRPRLMPTDAIETIDTKSSTTSSASSGCGCKPRSTVSVQNAAVNSGEAGCIGKLTVSSPATSVDVTPISTPVKLEIDTTATEPASPLPEPIVDDESDEEMNEEDLMILNEFLRGQSNQSLNDVGSFRSLLSFTDLTGTGILGDDAVGSSAIPSTLPSTTEEEEPVIAKPAPPRRNLRSMLSLGSARSLSLRSLTETDPDERWINGELNRRISGISLIEDLTDQLTQDFGPPTLGEDEVGATDEKKLEDLQYFGEQVDALASASELVNTAYASTNVGIITSNGATNEVPFETLFYGDGASGTTTVVDGNTATTMTAQDFYSTEASLDLLSKADRFEI